MLMKKAAKMMIKKAGMMMMMMMMKTAVMMIQNLIALFMTVKPEMMKMMKIIQKQKRRSLTW